MRRAHLPDAGRGYRQRRRKRPNDCIYVLRSNIAELSRRINDLTENVTAGKALSAEEDELLHRYIRELTADLASFGVPDKTKQRKE